MTSTISSDNTGPISSLRHKPFRRFIVGATIANCGQFIQGLATPFLMNELTGSPAWVGASGFASLAPSIVFTPIAGALTDRLNRHKMLMAAYSVVVLMSLLYFVLYQADALTPWRIIIIQLLFGGVIGFLFAPIQAMPAVLVPSTDLMSAVRMLSISFTGSRALGPLIGGVALAISGPGLGFALAAVAFITGLVVVATIDAEQPVRNIDAPATSLLSDYREGVAFVRARPGLRIAVRNGFVLGALAAAIVFPLAASVASDILSTGGGGLGALGVALGIGSIVASLFIAGPGSRISLANMEAISLAVYCVGLLAVAATGQFVVGLFGFFVVGVAHMWHNVSLSTSMQLGVTDEVRGRVMSVWMVFLLAGIPLGALAGGFIANATSTRLVVLLYTAMIAAYLAYSWFGVDRMQALNPQHAAMEQ